MAKIEELSLCHSGLDPESSKITDNGGQSGSRLGGRDDNPDLVRASRIVADHIRTAVFMIADSVTPSNTDRGYILRRILRRAVRYADKLGMVADSLSQIADVVIAKYGDIYSNLKENSIMIKNEISKEENKFRETLEKGLREFEKGRDPFDLYQSFGFPIELAEELAKEKGVTIDRTKFDEEMKKHQALSRQGAEQKFKGGLAGDSDQVVKYHTATHLLQQALVDVLGPAVAQKGSNITEERLRFDFAFDRKMTEEEKQKVEEIVNEKIQANLLVNKIILSKAEAEKTGARHLFSEKYGDEVSIYYIGDSLDSAYSKEFCGGPHVENTGVLGHFKISKEEAVAAGVRRIKAVLE
jgi:alanyl-tRNA synthetase